MGKNASYFSPASSQDDGILIDKVQPLQSLALTGPSSLTESQSLGINRRKMDLSPLFSHHRESASLLMPWPITITISDAGKASLVSIKRRKLFSQYFIKSPNTEHVYRT